MLILRTLLGRTWLVQNILLVDIRQFTQARSFLTVLRHVMLKHDLIARADEALYRTKSKGRFGGGEFCVVLSNVNEFSAKAIEERLMNIMQDLEFIPEGHDSLIPVTVTVGAAVLDRGSLDWHKVMDCADERLRTRKSGGSLEEESASVRALAMNNIEGFSMLNALVISVDNKDRYTRRHSEDVMTYCSIIAAELGLDASLQHTPFIAALLHDVGKIGVPDAILRKPGWLMPSLRL